MLYTIQISPVKENGLSIEQLMLIRNSVSDLKDSAILSVMANAILDAVNPEDLRDFFINKGSSWSDLPT